MDLELIFPVKFHDNLSVKNHMLLCETCSLLRITFFPAREGGGVEWRVVSPWRLLLRLIYCIFKGYAEWKIKRHSFLLFPWMFFFSSYLNQSTAERPFCHRPQKLMIGKIKEAVSRYRCQGRKWIIPAKAVMLTMHYNWRLESENWSTGIKCNWQICNGTRTSRLSSTWP